MLLLITLVVVALLAVGSTVALVSRWPAFGLACVGIFVVLAWEVPQTPPIASVLGTQVFIEDILCISFLVAGVVRRAEIGRTFDRGSPSASIGLTFLCLLLIINLVIGTGIHGLGTAVNEFRSFFYLIAIFVWALSLDWRGKSANARLRVWIMSVGWLLVGVATFHTVRYGLGGADSFFVEAGFEQTGRPLVASQALILACAALWALHTWSRTGAGFSLVSSLAFLAVVLIAQHRSVWFAVTAGGILLILGSSVVSRQRLIMGSVWTCWLLAVLVLSGSLWSVFDKLVSSLFNDGTYRARSNAWSLLIEASLEKGVSTVLFGAPFGTGWSRVNNGLLETFAPHNWYVTIYLRVGVIGFVGFAIAVIAVFAALVTTGDRRTLPLVVFSVLLVYSWAYTLTWFVGPVLAWVVAASRSGSPPTYSAVPRSATRFNTNPARSTERDSGVPRSP